MLSFYRQVREQILRVTPTGGEVWVTSVMVVILAIIMSFLIYGADSLILFCVTFCFSSNFHTKRPP